MAGVKEQLSFTYNVDIIKRQADAGTTQFITTTFRLELVKIADRAYGVTHKNRVSGVDVITKDESSTSLSTFKVITMNNSLLFFCKVAFVLPSCGCTAAILPRF
uniref:Uncharacterized protein n=1 Tax=Physcomitrium patens TaxID=3218 RepID=A0A2K1K815_PHYPA|nr:hypothetical protein PHYPA_011815 [Physcomitrium patens]